MSELVTVGETMLRLSPPTGQRLSRVDSFDVHVGGAESNVAVAAANLGTESTWLSALPDSDLGTRVVHALQGEGIDTAVTWTESGRVGTYYLERGGAPRGDSVVYDRGDTPIRDVTPADLQTAPLRAADCVFTSGITPALSAQAATTTASLLETAQESGATTAVDVNYRSKLWTPADARETLTDLFSLVDILVVAERDAQTVLQYDGDSEAIARSLAADYEFETVVLTRGESGALAVGDGLVEQPAFETDTVDAVGSGDAFVGGFLARRLDGAGLADALETGAAAAALKRTVMGDMAQFDPADIAAVINDDDAIDR
jgi:2-dehydro-3-deoxygluconokinase